MLLPANLNIQAQALAKMFSDEYGFMTETCVLDPRTRKPEPQLHLSVAKFVYTHDGHHQSNLIILYYGGYAITGRVKDDDDHDEIFLSA